MSAVLGIDPGYSSTRVGVFDGNGTAVCTVRSGDDPMEVGESLAGRPLSVVVVPGGPPAQAYPWHPRNIMAARAGSYCATKGIPCITALPASWVELNAKARLSGFRECDRRGNFYATPQMCAFEKAAKHLGVPANSANVITVYLGDEVSVSAHSGHEVVDTSDPVACEGPFGFTSAGTLPATSFVSYLTQAGVGRTSGAAEAVRSKLKTGSGVFSYAGVGDAEALAAALAAGHEGAARGVQGMAYQVAKEVGRQIAALRGKVDCVALCGPGASLDPLVSGIELRVRKWAALLVFAEDLVMPHLIGEGIRALSSNCSLSTPRRKES